MVFRKIHFLFYTLGLSALTLLAYVYRRYDPMQHAWFPKCPFKALTGLDCPGCGSQRAIHALLHGEFAEAFQHNVLILPFLPYIALGLLFRLVRNPGQGLLLWRKILYGEWAIKVVAVVILLHFVIRNIQ